MPNIRQPLRLAFFLVALGLVHVVARADQKAQFVLTLDGATVVAKGFTPGSSVAVTAVAFTKPGDVTVESRRDFVMDDGDGNGVAEYAPTFGVARNSVWVAVDLSNGDVAAVTGDLNALHIRDLPERWITPAADHSRTRGEVDASRAAEILIVRPGIGAWAEFAVDGGARDVGPPNDNHIVVEFKHGQHVHGSQLSPDTLSKGDVVVFIDEYDLSVSVGRVRGEQ